MVSKAELTIWLFIFLDIISFTLEEELTGKKITPLSQSTINLYAQHPNPLSHILCFLYEKVKIMEMM